MTIALSSVLSQGVQCVAWELLPTTGVTLPLGSQTAPGPSNGGWSSLYKFGMDHKENIAEKSSYIVVCLLLASIT
jgi:hypothetical protein